MGITKESRVLLHTFTFNSLQEMQQQKIKDFKIYLSIDFIHSALLTHIARNAKNIFKQEPGLLRNCLTYEDLQ